LDHSQQPAAASENRVMLQRSTEIRVNFHLAAQPIESAANRPVAPCGCSLRSEKIREFPTDFRVSGDFSGTGANFREPEKCTPCATSVHWRATPKRLRQQAFSQSRRFDRLFGPKQ
jgi:hypothetical protein